MKNTITTCIFFLAGLAVAQQDSHRNHLSARHPHHPNSQHHPNPILFRRKAPSPSPSPPRTRPSSSFVRAQDPSSPGAPPSAVAGAQAGRGRFNPSLPWVPAMSQLPPLPPPQGLPPLSREGPIPGMRPPSPQSAARQAQLMSDIGSIVRGNTQAMDNARAARAARTAHMRQPGNGASGRGGSPPQPPSQEPPLGSRSWHEIME